MKRAGSVGVIRYLVANDSLDIGWCQLVRTWIIEAGSDIFSEEIAGAGRGSEIGFSIAVAR